MSDPALAPPPAPETDPRRPYEPPALLRVPLRPEEAVLGACKTAGVCTIATLGS